MQVPKTKGQYRVLLPPLPRHRTRKFIDVLAMSEEEAIRIALSRVEDDYLYNKMKSIWLDSGQAEILKVFREPEWETTEDRQARSDRARQRALEARARRARGEV